MGSNPDAVTFTLQGGLGNQLFQYAAGRAVSLRLGVPLILDTGYIDDRVNFRPLSIKHFNHAARLQPDNSRYYLFGYPIFSRLRIIRAALRGKYVAHETSGIDQRVFSAGPGTLFLGYWQWEGYFQDIEHQLRQDLTFREAPPSQSVLWLEKIKNAESVSVHVRRGDYVPAPGQSSDFAPCLPGYYLRAAELIAARCRSALQFFIFSDEPQWVRDNIRLPGKMHVIDHNGPATAHEDMRLMAACRHNIIANSTFSWWGAWLNANPGKIVIAPKTWYSKPNPSNEFINAKSFTLLENVNA